VHFFFSLLGPGGKDILESGNAAQNEPREKEFCVFGRNEKLQF